MGSENNPQIKGVLDFLTYLKAECSKKEVMEIKMSFDELEFLKKMVVDSIKGMEGATYNGIKSLTKE